MARKKNTKKRRSHKVYLFVVEGCTEENYIKRMKKIYKKAADIANCNGGSARNVMYEAEKLYDKNSDYYSKYIVWFDDDTYDHSRDNNLKEKLNAKNNLTIYYSKPCIENWILAHFQKINLMNDQKCNECIKKLFSYIPNYEKNDCNLLDRYIDYDKVQNAIANYPKLGKIIGDYFK